MIDTVNGDSFEMDSGDTKDKKPIPKFASFKPKASPPAPSSASTDARSEYEKDRTSSRHERSRHDSRHSRPRDHSRSRKDGQDRHREHRTRHGREVVDLPAQRPESAQQRPSNREDHELYIIDKKGDKYNITYGGLHRYSIPQYYRVGSGRVIGLPPSYRIDLDALDGNNLVIRHNMGAYDSARHKYRELLRKQAKKETKLRVRPDPENNPAVDSQKDFLPLSSDGSRKRRRLHGAIYSRELTPDEDPIDYRSIEGKAKPSEEIPEDLEVVSDSDSASDDESARRRNAELSRRVTEHPDDLDGWLKLIDHQNSLVGVATSDGQRRLTTAEKRSVADIKMSMYEKALRKMPPKAPRDRLLLGMMEEASILYDTKALSNKWKDILRANPDYISLWIKFLDFQQTRFVSFTYEQCRSIFIDCLKINAYRRNSPELNVINVYLILRLSLFMRQAGFVEHAVGLWQALLEFNFFHAKAIEPSKDAGAATSAFCEFWDSEVARIGEIGAKGWDSTEGSAPDSKSDPASRGIDKRSVFESWEQSERYQMRYSRLPARTLDEVQEDDPYRVVISSDITDFLIPLSDVPDLLIGAFMIFCGLPTLSLSGNADVLAQWCRDPFIRNSLLDTSEEQSTIWFSEVAHAMEDPVQNHPHSFPLPTFVNNTDTLFGDESWFSGLRIWQSTYMSNQSPIDGEWVRRTMRHLVNRLPQHDDLAEYTAALEFFSNPNEAKKYTKSLLKKRSSDLRLYNIYALIEYRSNQISTAEHVWTTALSMSKSFKEENKVDNVLLWRTWIWEVLANQDNDKAIRLLLAIPHGTVDLSAFSSDAKSTASISPAEFLKTQRFLTEAQEHGLASRKPNTFVSATECLAMLTYFPRKFDIDSAINIYAVAHSRLPSHKLEKTIFSELLLQAKAKLLYHHATSTRIYKPSLLRTELTDSIFLFPENTIFLSLFTWNESRFRIEDRVRSVLRQNTAPTAHSNDDDNKKLTTDYSTHSTLIPHLFSIYTELHRGVSAGSTVHSARAAFESAVSSPSGQSSASIWKLYVLFELALSQWGRARDIFYRAIRACPWVKELVLLAFRERGLRELMGQDELRKVWNVLAEKELRVHVDLEEWFEERGQGREAGGEAGNLPFDMPEDASGDED